MHLARNIRPAFKYGLIPGLINAAIDHYIFRGHAPWTFKYKKDCLNYDNNAPVKSYPKPDDEFSFDIASSLYLSNISHDDNQPSHLQLLDINKISHYNYCPAAVYSINEENKKLQLDISSQNCLHCKACDIKDKDQNITWNPPEGGSGPQYTDM